MKTLKLLALVAATVVVAACNGTSPVSPNAIVASDDAAALVESPALKGQAIPPGLGCRDITEVKLHVLRSPGFASPGLARIQARYLNGDMTVNCRIAPAWSSLRGRIRPTRDPFVVEAILTLPPSTVQVTAKAPNGVQGSIRIQ